MDEAAIAARAVVLAGAVPKEDLYKLLARQGAVFAERREPQRRWRRREPVKSKLVQIRPEQRSRPNANSLQALRNAIKRPETQIYEEKALEKWLESKTPKAASRQYRLLQLASHQGTNIEEKKKASNFIHGLQVSLQLENIRRMLPEAYRPLKPEDEKRKAMIALQKLCFAGRATARSILDQAWNFWLLYLSESRKYQRHCAAVRINSFVRKILAIYIIDTLKKHRSKQQQLEDKRIASLLKKTNTSALIIARNLRRFHQRTRIWHIIILHRAALVVQCRHRMNSARIRTLFELALFQKRTLAALRLQRLQRGRSSRSFCHRLRRQRNIKIIESRFYTASSALNLGFEIQGAAVHIQRWWRMLDWRIPILKQRAAIRITRLLHEAYNRQQLKQWMQSKIKYKRRLQLAQIRLERHAAKRIVKCFILHHDRLRAKRVADAAIKTNREAAIRLHQIHQEVHLRAKLKQYQIHQPILYSTLRAAIIKLQRRHRHHRLVESRKRKGLLGRAIRSRSLLQRWVRSQLLRLRRERAGALISGTFVPLWQHYRRRVTASTCIQSQARRMIAQSRYHTYRKRMLILVNLVNAQSRRVLAIKIFDMLLVGSRAKAERRLAASKMVKFSRERELHDQILKNALVNTPNHDSELQRLFTYYCSLGNKENTSRLSLSSFTRFVQEAMPDIISSATSPFKSPGKHKKLRLSQTDFELIFTKCRVEKETHLRYRDFYTALREIAEKLYPHQSSVCGRLQGSDAKFCNMILDHVMHSATVGDILAQRLNKPLEYRHSYSGRASTTMENAATRICNRRRIRVARSAMAARRRALEIEIMELERHKAAVTIQRVLFRGTLDRKKAATIAITDVYEKIIDAEHKRAFWFNPRTNAAVWIKPKIMAWMDVVNTVSMPDKDRLYQIKCPECNKHNVTHYCVDCASLLCQTCSDDRHRERQWRDLKDHSKLRVEVCAHCGFQIGTKLCRQCEDNFCDTCFFDQHARGVLQSHTYDKVQPHCNECLHYTARKVFTPDPNYPNEAKQLCLRCVSGYCSNTREVDNLPDVPYVPKALRLYQADVEEHERRARIQADHQKKALIMAQEHYDRKVRKLQRVLRGYCSRLKSAPFIAQRRAWFRQRQQEDEHYRRKSSYVIKNVFGFAPMLGTDTDVEIVLQRVPCWERNTIRDVVNGEWEEFARYVREQRDFVIDTRGGKRPPIKLLCKLVLARCQQQVLLALAVASSRRVQNTFERYQNAYRIARSANEKKEIRDDLRTKMRRQGDLVDLEKARVSRISGQVVALHQKIADVLGPRTFRRKVNEAIKYGIPVAELAVEVKAGSNFVEPVDACLKKEVALKPGDRIRIGNSERVYRLVPNHGLPSLLDNAKLQVRRFVARVLIALDENEESLDEIEILPDDKKKRLPSWQYDPTNLDKYKLHAMWNGDDAGELPVYRYPRRSIAKETLSRAMETIHTSPIVQIPLRLELFARSRIRHRCLSLADKVDKGSKVEQYLRRHVDTSKKCSTRRARFLTKAYDAEEDTIIDAVVGSHSRKHGKRHPFLARMNALAIKVLAMPVKIALQKYRQRLELITETNDPCRLWEMSTTKQILHIEEGTDDTKRRIASLEIDLLCSLHTAREIFRRKLWQEFNDKEIGAAFDFLGDDKRIESIDEEKIKLDEVSSEDIKRESNEVEYIIGIVKIPGKIIPMEPYHPKSKAEDIHAKLPMKLRKEDTGLWSDDEEEEDDDSSKDESLPRNSAEEAKEALLVPAKKASLREE